MTKEYRDNSEHEHEGAREEQNERIEGITGSETLGYKGEAREEHSGQTSARPNPDPPNDLADNRPSQISESAERAKKTEG
jgi:hypothetical protein